MNVHIGKNPAVVEILIVESNAIQIVYYKERGVMVYITKVKNKNGPKCPVTGKFLNATESTECTECDVQSERGISLVKRERKGERRVATRPTALETHGSPCVVSTSYWPWHSDRLSQYLSHTQSRRKHGQSDWGTVTDVMTGNETWDLMPWTSILFLSFRLPGRSYSNP